ncbi:hypothetical protein LPJ72_000576 [Coemansia sp. Benny D160-2]|nr:hypothetical protein LPJ72_000576 [Coemansia sp. Benny D160-2]
MPSTQQPKVARSGNLDGSSSVSETADAWRAYACMVPFTASDGTSLLMLYGGSSSQDTLVPQDPLKLASKGDANLHVFDEASSKWYAPSTANAPANGPVLPGCGAADGGAWVYDPHYGVSGSDSTPVTLLDTVHWSWSSPTESGLLPVKRFGAAFAYVPSKAQFYMHGGIPLTAKTNEPDDPPGIANNLDILNPTDLSWSYASNGPARKYHSICYVSSIDALVLFGGSDQNIDSYNDLKVFSLKSNTWLYSLKINGDSPAERLLHSAVCTDSSMLVFGGTRKVGDAPSDSSVWILKPTDETEFTWSKAPIATTDQLMGPAARAGHSAALRNNSMYIYGGIGPGGQDSVMYKLDMGDWKWSQTNVTGSSPDVAEDRHTLTAVLIAALVSSILGIITIGISATVIYRFVQRRYGIFARADNDDNGNDDDVDDDEDSGGGHHHALDIYGSGKHAVLSDSKPGSPMGPAANRRSRSIGDPLYSNQDSGEHSSGGGASEKPSDIAGPNGFQATADDIVVVANEHTLSKMPGTDPPHSPQDYAAISNTVSEATTPASIGTGRALLPAALFNNGHGSHTGRVLSTMRAHARSLSTRLAPSQLSTAFSDDTSVATATTPTPTPAFATSASRTRRAETSASAAAHRRHPRRRSANANQRVSAVNIYGHDQVRLENEFRHAEAINEILLSDQPIPAWLREAVAQSQQTQSKVDDSNHRHEHRDDEAANTATKHRVSRAVSDVDASAPGSQLRTEFKVVNSFGSR